MISENQVQERQLCPECQKINEKSFLRYMYISLTEAVLKCENAKCMYPFRNFTYKRFQRGSNDSLDNIPTSTSPVVEHIQNDDNDLLNEILASLESSSTNTPSLPEESFSTPTKKSLENNVSPPKLNDSFSSMFDFSLMESPVKNESSKLENEEVNPSCKTKNHTEPTTPSSTRQKISRCLKYINNPKKEKRVKKYIKTNNADKKLVKSVNKNVAKKEEAPLKVKIVPENNSKAVVISTDKTFLKFQNKICRPLDILSSIQALKF